MSNEAADQPTIQDILEEYDITADTMDPDRFNDLLDTLRSRDNIMQSDCYILGKLHAFKEIRKNVEKIADNIRSI